jgi:hypothetical protein
LGAIRRKSMKKRTIYTSIFLGALLLFAGACAPLLNVPAASSGAADGEGTVVLSINGSDARTLAPKEDEFVKYEVYFYKITKQAVAIPGIGNIIIEDVSGNNNTLYVGEFEDVQTVEKSVTLTSLANVRENLESGKWQITVVGYGKDAAGNEVPSVYGSSGVLTIVAGGFQTINLFLDTPAAQDQPGYLEYNIRVPYGVVRNYDSGSRDAYNSVLASPGGDYIGSGGKVPANYYSGAVLRIIPDPVGGTPPDADHVSALANSGNIFIDLNYSDESPGNGSSIYTTSRLTEGKIELPPGRYKLYLSLVSDRSIITYDASSNPVEDYIGIFKEEVVYIYPNVTTRTPPSYTTFTSDDLSARVFFEGHATVVNSPEGRSYTPQRVWVDRQNSPSTADGSSHGEWSAPIVDKSGGYEWNLYIPSHDINTNLDVSTSGSQIFFRFEMSDGEHTLLSPWQQYHTLEKQGQADIDLYAVVEKITVPPSVTITTAGVYADTVQLAAANEYDVVRGVNFSSPEASKVLFNVTPADGKAIAYFEARAADPYSYPNSAIAWRYADSNFNYSPPATYPSAVTGWPVVYEIENGEASANTGLDHETDNSQISSSADLGRYPVNVTTDFFNFNVALTLPADNLPVYNQVRLEVRDAATGTQITQATTGAGSPFTWTIAPEDELPVYTSGFYTYSDYGIYDYDTIIPDPNKVVISGYDYSYTTTKGVYFVVTLEELDYWGYITNSYALAPTRRYTTAELVGQVSLGIDSAYGLSGERTISRNTGNTSVSGLSYAPATDYYYFAVDQGITYYLDYAAVTAYGSVTYSYTAMNTSPTTIGGGTYTAPGKGLVTAAVTASSFFGIDDSGTYRLTVEPPELISAQGTSETKSIAQYAVRYYTYTPPAGSTPVYVEFDDVNSSPADVDVKVYTYTGTGPLSGPTLLTENIQASIPVPPGQRVLIEVTDISSTPGTNYFTLTVTQ